jgi:hypothetical protein
LVRSFVTDVEAAVIRHDLIWFTATTATTRLSAPACSVRRTSLALLPVADAATGVRIAVVRIATITKRALIDREIISHRDGAASAIARRSPVLGPTPRDRLRRGVEQEPRDVDVVLQRRPPTRWRHARVLAAETVERLAMLRSELLRERDVLVVPTSAILLGEARAEDPHVFLVEGVANAEILAHLLHEFLGDRSRAHREQV